MSDEKSRVANGIALFAAKPEPKRPLVRVCLESIFDDSGDNKNEWVGSA